MSVLPANIQDRAGARDLLEIFAAAGYQGSKMARTIAATECWTIEIVKRSEAKGFVVSNAGSWNGRSPGSAETVASCAFERYATTVTAFIRLAMIGFMLKRLTRATHCS